MTHVDRDTLALLALDGDAGRHDEHRHVTDCADCREALEEFRETVRLARSLSGEERQLAPPPPRVWDAIVNELADSEDLPAGGFGPAAADPAAGAPGAGATRAEAAEAGRPDAEIRPLRRDGPGAPGVWLAAAAAVVVLAVVAATAVFALREPAPSLVADTTLEPLIDVGPATARLLEGPRGLKIEVRTAGLPEPDGYYELWLIDTEVSRLISLGPLAEDRLYLLPPGLDVAEFPVVDISLEPFDGDPAHSGNSVLRGVLPLDSGAQG